MTFSEELSEWIDEEGLVGNQLNPSKWSTGNPLLETSFGSLISEDLSYSDLSDKLQNAIMSCKSDNGLFNKNPGRLDQITFDCLIGAASSSKRAANSICEFGSSNKWVMSNTGKIYWTAVSKPQYIAFYKIAAGRNPSLVEQTLLLASLAFSAKDPSGKRLEYLILRTCKNYSWIFKMLFNRFIKKIGSMKQVHKEYYQNSEHPYCKYGVE